MAILQIEESQLRDYVGPEAHSRWKLKKLAKEQALWKEKCGYGYLAYLRWVESEGDGDLRLGSEYSKFWKMQSSGRR